MYGVARAAISCIFCGVNSEENLVVVNFGYA